MHPDTPAHPDPTAPHVTRHDVASERDLSVTVVMAVASVVETDPLDLHERLDDVVDPDALDDIFRPQADGTRRAGGCVSFVLHGHDVTVWSDGTIVVQPK